MYFKKYPDDFLAEAGFLRLNGVLKKLNICRAKWLQGVASGRYPRGIKVPGKPRVWSIEVVQQLIDSGANLHSRTYACRLKAERGNV